VGQLLVGQSVALEVDDNDLTAADGTARPPGRLDAFVLGTAAREYLLTLSGEGGAPPALRAGQGVTVTFTTTMGLHAARTSVLRITAGKTVVVAIAPFGTVDTQQRRHYFRPVATLPVSVAVTSSALPGSVGKEDPRAVTHDVSPGGLRLETALPVARGDRLTVTVQTPRSVRRSLPAALSCEAVVVRVEPVARRNQNLFSAGVEFQFAAERERDRWVQLTFELQRG
jgi:c-di-GMP-binding flagellar brake protein YcgR